MLETTKMGEANSMKIQKKTKAVWVVVVALVAQMALLQSASAVFLINDPFNVQDATTWTTNGPQSYTGELNLQGAQFSTAAGIRSIATFTGASQEPLMTAVLPADGGDRPNAFVGFADLSNFGGTGANPYIWLRSDQTAANNPPANDWWIQVYDGISINQFFNTGMSVQPNQKVDIFWGTSQVRFRIDNGNNGSWDYTYASNVSVGGSQHVQVGDQNGVHNFLLDSLTVESVPEPTALTLCAIGIVALARRRARK